MKCSFKDCNNKATDEIEDGETNQMIPVCDECYSKTTGLCICGNNLETEEEQQMLICKMCR